MEPVTINQAPKEFKVNKNSWLMKFYMYVRTDGSSYLPVDSCKLRNDMIKSFLLFLLAAPMFLIIKPIVRRFDLGEVPTWIPLVVSTIGFMTLSIVDIEQNGIPWVDSSTYALLTSLGFEGPTAFLIGWYFMSILSVLLMALIILVFVGMVLGVYNLYKLIPKTPKKTSVTGKLYSDLRKKVCTPVTYTND